MRPSRPIGINKASHLIRNYMAQRGWATGRAKSHHSNSVYVFGRAGYRKVVFRFSDHSPNGKTKPRVSLSAHPGGDTLDDMRRFVDFAVLPEVRRSWHANRKTNNTA